LVGELGAVSLSLPTFQNFPSSFLSRVPFLHPSRSPVRLSLPFLPFGISYRVTHCQYSQRLHLVNSSKVPLSGSCSFCLSKTPISDIKNGATVRNIVAAQTLRKVRRFHRVETKISGSFSWILSGRFCCVFPFVWSLLGSFLCVLLCGPCLVPSCVSCCVVLAWFLPVCFRSCGLLCSHREQKRNFIACLYISSTGIHYRGKAMGNGKE
jgi:hypothetical protein